MIRLDDIESLTDFQRHSKRHIQRLKKTGRATVLTVNGRATLVVQDAKSYQRLLDLLERAAAIEGVERGLASLRRGEGRPARAVLDEIRTAKRIPRHP
jgi:hypothetical protein